MNPSRWRRVNELFHAALEQPPTARNEFLQIAAAGDADLIREVQSLLDTHDRTKEFLDSPAWGIAPDLLVDEPESSLVGRQIGVYRVVEEIGRGGMGVVYAAEDQRLGRSVALKALPAAYTRDPLRRERLTREARAAAALSHPAIATIFALEEIDGELYIVSELVPGRTLRDELGDGALPPDRLLETLLEIASALSAAHARGIVHRDLKPENIVRRSDGQIKILDFGLARFERAANAPSVTRLTEAGVAVGTPGYMAPEQLRGGRGDARSDLFAFGVLAWELAIGEHPFGTDQGAILARMTELMEGRASTLSRPLPIPGLDHIARRCMRGFPDDRYPSADALLYDLRLLRPTSDSYLAIDRGGGSALWWWQFHQGIVAAVDASTPILVWFIRRWADKTLASWAFFTALSLATTSVTLRLNLLFTSRVHPATLAAHRARLFRWIAAAEAVLALILLGSAVTMAGTNDAMAAALVTLAIVMSASIAIIEPATTGAAGLTGKKGERKK